MQLIGLTGRARTGKDTTARMLSQCGFSQYAFANPIKEGVKTMFGFTDDCTNGNKKEQPVDWLDGVTPRQIMQTLGTEWGRQCIHPDLWLIMAKREWHAVQQLPRVRGMVVSDVRFENEADWIREAGGEVWHIRRCTAMPVREHASEAGVTFCDGDRAIDNNGSIFDLSQQVKALIAADLELARC